MVVQNFAQQSNNHDLFAHAPVIGNLIALHSGEFRQHDVSKILLVHTRIFTSTPTPTPTPIPTPTPTRKLVQLLHCHLILDRLNFLVQGKLFHRPQEFPLHAPQILHHPPSQQLHPAHCLPRPTLALFPSHAELVRRRPLQRAQRHQDLPLHLPLILILIHVQQHALLVVHQVNQRVP